MVTSGGFMRFRRATEPPFRLVFDARRSGKREPWRSALVLDRQHFRIRVDADLRARAEGPRFYCQRFAARNESTAHPRRFSLRQRGIDPGGW
jgi:hypothetical protein